MSAQASKAVLGNDGDATLATGCLCCGSSDNVIGGEYAVIAHEFHGTVHYSMVATDQQLSQCNMLAPISVGQAGAAYTAAVQSTGVAADSVYWEAAADSVYWEAAPWSSRPHVAAFFSLSTTRPRSGTATTCGRPFRHGARARPGRRRRRGSGRGARRTLRLRGTGRRTSRWAILHCKVEQPMCQ